ncbi:probable cytochrome P450 6a13 [Planococcus citri]|uniref:probable cytochrome P450 6a13 n=1 Tax=Planococcus citri TaxID=170843 RepID=UPI0031F858E6
MEDPNSPILRMARKIFQFRFKTIFRHAIPHPPKLLLKMFKLSYMDEEVQDFFMTTMRKAINLRKRSLNPRNDLVTILLFNKNRHISENPDLDQEKMSNGEHNEPIEEETTMEFKVAQCYVFFAAGFETTSSALSYLMMELALNRSIQNKVREEIIEILQKYNGEITNDSVREMTYTDMVISEGLRLHAPAVILIRKCTKEYQIPNSKAIIPEKMLVVASVLGLHKDPRYYEKPDEFYPEHFTEEAKNNRPSCAYIPFGEGPRACIGERFAKFEIKLAVIHMIKDYVFEISPKMKFPLEYAHDMKLGLMAPRGGIWLQCKKYEMQKPLTSYTSYEEKLDLLDLDSLDSMAE